MDLFDFLLSFGLITAALVAYLLMFRRSTPHKYDGAYRNPAWNYPFRLLSARFAVKRWKAGRTKSEILETPREDQNDGWDGISVRASAPDGATVLLAIRKVNGKPVVAEVTVHVKLADGTSYKLPQHPDTAVSVWDKTLGCWSAGGLKIQVLEPQGRLRITFNGLLTNVATNTTQHAKFNFIWASVTHVMRHPEDWSDDLAARALALEPWRNSGWRYTLGKWKYGNWMQWGTVQGRFQTFTKDGAVDTSVYLETRGTRERSWSPQGYRGLRRTVTITAAAKDGTAVQLYAFSYKDVLTLGFSGTVRYPDFSVNSITGTNLILANFCEHPDTIPKVYKLNVSTSGRDFILVLRINEDGGKLYSGIPYQYETYYRTLSVEINGNTGTGLLELGYETSGSIRPSVLLAPAPVLKWLSEQEVGDVGYCVSFEDKAARCTNYVGGKGASLALLVSVQHEQGYRVPPGFCLTTKALDKYLEINPKIKEAIKAIEAANEDYDEKKFKEKCDRAVGLFTSTEISGEILEEVLSHLTQLRKKTLEENLGPDLRFAVRSSAVGEDSEALSAAGQNETFLGCVSDVDVLKGVQKCWGSMFAFTSAHYRRQNGQPCLCGGAVVVQALVSARAAGVMFSRHPELGDPARLLLTANYGLGESVVSGAVEPDTIVVNRGDELTIAKIELGSKKQRIVTSEIGVVAVDVTDVERKTPCISVTEALRLAQIGVAQEIAWGAGRDIEWAIVKDEIFLLQARPITSLERWTEEELLHELDFPIMADDELLTFANTGEVMPKPLTALSHDLVYEPLTMGVSMVMHNMGDVVYERSTVITHNRATLALYNSLYRTVAREIDVGLRTLEMAVHGHKVADESILSVALHRRPFSRYAHFKAIANTVGFIMATKSSMQDTIRVVNNMVLETDYSDPETLLEDILKLEVSIKRCSYNHATSTSGSAASQFLAMIVLVEGESDFTPEQCNEMNSLLSSGDVLSAEVPQALAKFANDIEKSGQRAEFRAQNPKQAMNWLKINLNKIYNDVCKFLETHGHRAIMEFDLSTKPWVLVPEEMMKVLQTMRPSNDEKQASKSDAEIVASLKTPKKNNTRRVLKWLLPLCRRTVRHREATKAHLILGVHKVRMACLRLARMLVRRWYLPDVDLIFHFRLNELRDYIRTRDPALLKKASQRRQYYPSWCKLKFAEMNTGWVRPLQSKGPRVTGGDVRIEATAACVGEVIARACVVKDLSEIDQLQQGDILITHSTDIGWSPYFPLVSGIVTELGGLISHGAVIAREYGLPCLVGAAEATDMFQTGDLVRLAGSIGVLEKVTLEETANTEAES